MSRYILELAPVSMRRFAPIRQVGQKVSAAQYNRPCYNSSMPEEIIFLKLGGSLITDKSRTRTAFPDVIRRLTDEIARARSETPGLRLVLGHGSGSFGHVEAKKYGTADGVRSAEDWRGFAAVWAAADQLNRIIMDSLSVSGVPAVRIAPSSCAILDSGRLVEMPVAAVKAALSAGVLPVVYGDAVFDRARGGGIASTEMVFAHFARELHPRRVLLAGIERGVFEDYPARKVLRSRIQTGDRESLRSKLQGSAHADVTGGMLSKVFDMLDLIQEEADLRVLVFSGEAEGNVRRALAGEAVEGTVLEK
jgi:isopentenyl phosphate kinase